MSRGLASLVIAGVITVGCKRGEVVSKSEGTAGQSAARGSKERIEQLARTCEPADFARLIVIAAGPATSTAASRGSERPMRCEAMKKLVRRVPLPQWRDTAVTARWTASLELPETRDALTRMLQDTEAWCRIDESFATGTEPSDVSPADAALWVLLELPVSTLRSAVENVSGAKVIDKLRVLHEYDTVASHHESQWVARIDGMTVTGSPDGFGQLLRFLADGSPWGSISPSSEEQQKVHDHVIGAIGWLGFMAAQAPDTELWSRECVQTVRQALLTGHLGEQILADFDRYDPDVRVALMHVFRDTARLGSRARLEEIAKHDPDSRVREAAEDALPWADRGGHSSTIQAAGGSGSASSAAPL